MVASQIFGAFSNAAGATLPAASGPASSAIHMSPTSPRFAVLVHLVVVTQFAATQHAAGATPHIAAAAPHSTVVLQPAVVSRVIPGETPAKPQSLMSSRRHQSLKKACFIKRVAFEQKASASEEEPLIAERSAVARLS